MKHSEKVFNRLVEIQREHDCDLVESVVIFCDENDMDPADLVKTLDKNLIQELKYTAVKNNRVRRCVATAGPELV